MNTLEYLNYRKNKNDDTIADWITGINWKNSISKNPLEIIDQIFKISDPILDFELGEKISYIHKHDKEKDGRKITIVYDKDFSPCLLRSSTITHDGTLVFTLQCFSDLLQNIVIGATYHTNQIPENYLYNWESYDLKYTLGDILWNSKYLDHMDPEHGKNWPGQTDTMIIAVNIEYIKR